MSQPARVALATCDWLPEGDPDDAPLPALLGGRFVVWDDPAVDWDAFDLVVLRSTWDYHERRDAFLAWADARGERLRNPPAMVRWNTDKRYLGELAAAGIPVVPTAFVAPGEDLVVPDGPYVVKPAVSAGSRNTARFAPGEGERAAALVAHIHGLGRTAMVQPYVPSVDARGETALLQFAGAFSHAVRKGPLLRPGAAPIAEPFAPEELEATTASAAERALGERAVAWVAERFGRVPAYARVDVVDGADGAPLVLEVEITEPSLFLAHAPGSAQRFAAALDA